MATPRSEQLRSADLRAALGVVADMAAVIGDADGFARCGLDRLPDLAASELTTLSVCDLSNGRRHVTGTPAGAIGAAEREAFDCHFRDHPLVRYHAVEGGRRAHRISDSMPFARFRASALYADYYRRVGIDHAVALPIHVGDGWLVSFVLNRRGRDFSDREVALLDCMRAPLSHLFGHTRTLERAGIAWRHTVDEPPELPAALPLTARERQALRWVAAGKTDRDIAEIMAISPRTVHKHLQRVYAKLGVETRTAAVMRALANA
jgi:DNA-binding CsgD family transcriptional regulator